METHTFYVVGSALAVWALILSGLGVTRKGFPASGRAEMAVAAISIALVLGAIGTSIYDASNEQESDHEGGDESALILPL